VRQVVERLIDDFQERELPAPAAREITALEVEGKATAVIGMRRAGKTWFGFQRMRELLADGVPKRRLLYVNFEDERLMPFAAVDFQEILDAYYRKFPALKDQRCYLFLDEVQRIEGWERFVRRVLDSESLHVWVTGSSSKLLSSEIATSLRGRSLTTEIFPFSFREFLRFHGVDPDPQHLGSKTRARLQHMAARYLDTGGFPEVQNLDQDTAAQVLRNYVDVVILRDVIERHGVTNTVALRALIRHLLSAPATRFSVYKFYNSLRSQGVACTKNDLYAFLDHLADAFLVSVVPIYSRSQRARQANPRKVYAVDTGLLQAMSLCMTEERGAQLENLVFMHLRRQGLHPEYYVTRNGAEVDFVVRRGPRAGLELIQVCWSLDRPEARQREVRALRRAMEELGAGRGRIVTWMDQSSAHDKIAVTPAWKWLVGRES